MIQHFLQVIPSAEITKLDVLIDKLINLSVTAGKHILMALLIYVAGSFIIRLINHLVATMLDKRNVDVSIQTFLKSLVRILLQVLLVISIIGALGISTTSFAALLASAGVAIGMALSGNLQNFAGGIIVLLFKPYKVGDMIEAQGTLGKVREIQIFHTILTTPDNKIVYIPNGSLSSSSVVNYSHETERRVQWTVGVDYGQDVSVVREKLLDLFKQDPRILQEPDERAPFVGLEALADSSVNLTIRVWVKTEDYWAVYYEGQQRIYDMFNREQINIPYPQTVVHIQK